MSNEIEQLLADNTLKDIICSMPCDHPIQLELDNLIQQAHREGWEQGKREAASETDMEGGSKYKPGSWEQQALFRAAERIRAMEYKEKDSRVCGFKIITDPMQPKDKISFRDGNGKTLAEIEV